MLDLVLSAVPARDQSCDQLIDIDSITRRDNERSEGLGGQPLQQGAHRCHQHGRWALAGESPPDGQALTHGSNLGADPLERQGVPRREQQGRTVDRAGSYLLVA